ncbi:four-carbon acid sugar kinase family protein [Mucilaginibacter galii]|uniref:Membrane protein n=1 Tax=Mucilaginibacter galii TaxID=2005073 RepID=A0A917JAR0_9SPHI|nr:four-carbon acid sugar kinase family protein [Mucilaginibacter galii]GGI51654.1 membrane protein [Mucilaginibacter galii]
MIAVIADDLTGAAEVGGIGLQYGFTVEITTEVNVASTADLLVINTDSRSKGEPEAVIAVVKACKAIKALNPELIYKKIDSVMRGHVLAELEAEMGILERTAALIIPANPHLGRNFVNNTYLINGVPVHQTSFAFDPEFPVSGCEAAQMLRARHQPVEVRKHTELLPKSGIVVGEVETADDLNSWSTSINSTHYLGGSSGFFSALLKSLPYASSQKNSNYRLGKPVLFVSGTTFNVNTGKIKDYHQAGKPVSYMPKAIMYGQDAAIEIIDVWAAEIVNLLAQHGKALIAIDQNMMPDANVTALVLRRNMAAVVKQIFDNANIEELIIEGGSTAAAILSSLNINTLFPVQELAPGIIRSRTMYPQNIHVTLKPGSYPWSEKLWSF